MGQLSGAYAKDNKAGNSLDFKRLGDVWQVFCGNLMEGLNQSAMQRRSTHLKDEESRILDCKLSDDRVHLLAWLGP